MNNINRSWVNQRLDEHGYISRAFIFGLNTFIEFARSKPNFMDGDKVRCPCKNCHNKVYQEVDIAKFHLCKYGFVPNYTFWDRQGETSIANTSLERDDTNMSLNEIQEPSYREMVLDAAGPELISRTLDEEPNLEDNKFFNKLKAADKELWPGCEKVTQLSVVARLLNIKS